MLKRWIFCILLICLLFSIAGCGAQKEAAGNNIDGNYYLTEDLQALTQGDGRGFRLSRKFADGIMKA
ncbi:hypothetical protein [Selenomonas sp.]|uniref:hypothetical protein n=1 Tax=Selenomonas sp. TaxID=2053611 RepID=UPI0025DF4D73|nr:hypothetical protein [Selenomonas sp.]MCI6084681.1 hypothetical protein [Selenomonas sp.]MDY3297363.1 hypothetical protein [Selenomonas sp.]MDY4416585.1 hypothetical protein [Selenomonas sp.]